jgi:hypothetical protein
MAKKMVRISEAKFAKVHSKIKAFERKNGPIKVGAISLTNFLFANSEFPGEETESKPIRTKRIILRIAGDYTTSPNDLKGSIKLKSNLKYSGDEYSLLQTRLDKLVKEYKLSASASTAEVSDCEKVIDCIKLVDTKTSEAIPS